eukprot:TRINITY_DN9358_c0_g1_i1.p1 TRINITY_DN9358_c0_g1~~TRINITY_DN9358_c0_g1_i1.p1  ORF type:complete len:203 (+),score=19.53 TRINITY_DN9358_c0_g1_i1:286-894(+)
MASAVRLHHNVQGPCPPARSASSIDCRDINYKLELNRLHHKRGRHCTVWEDELPPVHSSSHSQIQIPAKSSVEEASWVIPFKGNWTPEIGMRRTRSYIQIDGHTVRYSSGNSSILRAQSKNEILVEGKDGRVHSGEIDAAGKLRWDGGDKVWVRTQMKSGRTERCKVCYGIGVRNYFTECSPGEKVSCGHCFGTGKRRPALG